MLIIYIYVRNMFNLKSTEQLLLDTISSKHNSTGDIAGLQSRPDPVDRNTVFLIVIVSPYKFSNSHVSEALNIAASK